MAQQPGDAAPPVQRQIEATRICYCESVAPAGKFTVTVACLTTRSVEFWRRRGGAGDDEEGPRDVIEQTHNAGMGAADPTRFPVADLAALRSDAACRATLRGMLASLPQLRALRLAEDEWDAVVLGELVPLIVDAARRGNGFAIFFRMKVHRRVVVDERGLLMACKERPPASTAAAPGEKDDDCAICFDGLERCGESAVVELPGCEHAFHGHCIAKWFSQVTTCPMCRGNVLLSALPKLIELSSTADAAEPAQGTTALPDDSA